MSSSEPAAAAEVREESSRKEIYTYNAPWTAYSLSWCRRGGPGGRFKLAVGSFIEEYSNEVYFNCIYYIYYIKFVLSTYIYISISLYIYIYIHFV